MEERNVGNESPSMVIGCFFPPSIKQNMAFVSEIQVTDLGPIHAGEQVSYRVVERQWFG